jgi:solute carrier family 8 (sodium/calcium exchanger)
MKGIRNHLYWCATSTKQGFEGMIVAKWRSFLRHVANKHKDHPDPLIKKCAHGEIERRDWIKIGMYKCILINNHKNFTQ